MEIGIYTFADVAPGGSHPQRLRQLVEEMELADQVGLDVFGLGEHHRPDYAVSAPVVALAAGAARTKNIRLTSAVTVLSSEDPVRVFQQFATLDGISNGRAEIMAGRGSFIESFPLFGYDLNDYDALFAEKLDLLLKLIDNETVSWQGELRPAARQGDALSAPRAAQDPVVDRGGRHAAVGGARGDAGAAHGARHHRRRPEALRALFRSLSRGMVARQPQAGGGEAEPQHAWLRRRHAPRPRRTSSTSRTTR